MCGIRNRTFRLGIYHTVLHVDCSLQSSNERIYAGELIWQRYSTGVIFFSITTDSWQLIHDIKFCLMNKHSNIFVQQQVLGFCAMCFDSITLACCEFWQVIQRGCESVVITVYCLVVYHLLMAIILVFAHCNAHIVELRVWVLTLYFCCYLFCFDTVQRSNRKIFLLCRCWFLVLACLFSHLH